MTERDRTGWPGLVAGLGLAALVVWHAVLLTTWLKKDTRPPGWDPAVHLMNALRFRDALARGDPAEVLRAVPAPGHPPYPPLTSLVMAAGFTLARPLGLGMEDAATLLSSLVFLTLLALGAGFFASESWGASTGVAAAALATLGPFSLRLSREPLVDLALAAWVVLSYGLWWRSDGFSSPRATGALGVALGAGLLTKWTFPTYVLPILGSAAWTFFVRRENPKLILAALGIAALLAAPWYVSNAVLVLPKILRAASLGRMEGDPGASTWAGWLFYPRALVQAWTWVGVLAGLAGLTWGFLRRFKAAVVLTLWLGSGLVIWTLVSNKDPRYIFPAAVVLPLAAASLPFQIPKALAVAAVAFSAGFTWAPAGRFFQPAVDQPWPLEAIVDAAASRAEGAAVLTLISNHAGLNGNNLTWTVAKKGLADRLTVRTRMTPLGSFSEFVVVKTGDLGPPRTVLHQEAARREVMDKTGWFQKSFHEAGRWPLPGGGEALLFQRNAPGPAPGGGAGAAALLTGVANGLAVEGFRATVNASRRHPGTLACRVSADRLSWGAVSVGRVRLALDGLRLARDTGGRPRVLDLKRVDLESVRWTAAEAERLLRARAPFLRDVHVKFLEGEALDLRARAGVPLRLRLSLENRGDAWGLRARRLEIAHVRVPLFLLGPWRDCRVSPAGRMPFHVTLPSLRTVPSPEGGVLEGGPR